MYGGLGHPLSEQQLLSWRDQHDLRKKEPEEAGGALGREVWYTKEAALRQQLVQNCS